MPDFEVEFWGGAVIVIKDVPNPDAALLRAIENRSDPDEWPGGYEATGSGNRFQAWVREIDE